VRAFPQIGGELAELVERGMLAIGGEPRMELYAEELPLRLGPLSRLWLCERL